MIFPRDQDYGLIIPRAKQLFQYLTIDHPQNNQHSLGSQPARIMRTPPLRKRKLKEERFLFTTYKHIYQGVLYTLK